MTFDEYQKIKESLKESDKYNFICDKFNISPILLSEIIQYQTYYIFSMLAASDKTESELQKEIFDSYSAMKESITKNTFAQTLEQNHIYSLLKL